MAFWLFKSEPDAWSWDQQVEAGRDGTAWTGVRNYQARNFMRAMTVGERGFFYHSNAGKAVVGIVEVAAAAHPDESAETGGTWECVDLRAVMALPEPVSLETIKADPRLTEMILTTNSRLSVQPVREAEFRTVCELGGLDPDKALG